MSVAEAMLGGCIPVVINAGSLPEVARNCGVILNDSQPSSIANAIRTAMDLPAGARMAVRQRIYDEFPLSRREESFCELLRSIAS